MQWLPTLGAWAVELLQAERETMLQLALAAALGAIVGLEREASGKPAGFRTNLLICLGAALLTVISRSVALEVAPDSGFRSDPGRIAAQIVSGIGFLGAGTIMQSRGAVTGLTTAATLWVVAAIGMAVGAGAYLPALLTTFFVILALMILGRVEDHLIVRRSSERTIEVVLDASTAELHRIEELLVAAQFAVTSTTVERGNGEFIAAFHLRGNADRYAPMVHTLLAEAGVLRVSLT